METDQLRRIAIIGISVLCLSPIEFFSSNLFEDKIENKNEKVVLTTLDKKLESNYLSNNYEIFNPNISTTSENIEKLVNENKKKEKTESENNLESEATEEEKIDKESKKDEIKEEKEKVVEKKEAKKETTSTKKVEKKYASNNQATVKKVEEEKKVEEPIKSVPQPNTDVATSLVNYAKQFVGNPYKSGGTDLYNGVDCSGFTMKIYEHFGYSLPHASKSQVSSGTRVSVDEMAPGDLIFYGYNGSVSHVAIYIGNGQIVHAGTTKTGIVIASYNIMPIITVKRILN